MLVNSSHGREFWFILVLFTFEREGYVSPDPFEQARRGREHPKEPTTARNKTVPCRRTENLLSLPTIPQPRIPAGVTSVTSP